MFGESEASARRPAVGVGALGRNPRDHRVEAAATRTREAMSRGANVIYQGRLDDDSGRWSGYPDFLLRLNRPSPLGR